MVCGVAALVAGWWGRDVVWLISLLWIISGLCVCIDGPVKVESGSGCWFVFVDGLVKGDGMLLLMGHICCLVHWYVLPCVSIM